MARSKKVKPVDLSKAMNEILTEYGDDVYKVMEECIDEVTEDAKNQLR